MRDYSILETQDTPISVDGYKEKVYYRQGLTVTVRQGESRIASIASKNIDYSQDLSDKMIAAIAQELKRTIKSLNMPKVKRILVVGLGNAGMTADALGVKTLSKITVTPPFNDGKKRVFSFAPSVGGLTGIDSNEAVLGVAKVTKPDLIIIVDTLATADVKKLARVAQIKNSGLVPGGGVGSDKPSLNKDYLGVSVVSIGIPLVIYLRHVVATYLDGTPAREKMDDSIYSLVVTPKEIDYTVEYFSTIIAQGIDLALDSI